MNKKTLEKSIQAALHQGEQITIESLSKKAITTFPEDSFGYAYLAEALLMQTPIPYGEVELCLAKASQLDPKNTNYLAQFAQLKSDRGEEGIAQILWGKILGLEPEHREALLAKGCYQLYQNEDYQQALVLFNQSIQNNLDHAEGYRHRAATYVGLEAYDKALKDYEYFLQLKKEEETLEELLLRLTILQGLDQKEAIADLYQTILSFDSNNATHHTNYAKILVALKRHAVAAEHYGRASELLEHQHSSTIYAWAEALENSNQPTKALEVYDIYIQQADQPTLGLSKQIPLHLQLEQYDLALSKITTLKTEHSEGYAAQRLVIQEGQALIGLEQYQKAVAILEPLTQSLNLLEDEALYLSGKALFMMDHNDDEAHRRLKAAAKQFHRGAAAFIKEHLAVSA